MAGQQALRVRAGIKRSTTSTKKGKGWRTNWRDRTNAPREKAQEEEGFLFTAGEYEDRHPRTLERNGGKPGIEAFYTRQLHRIAVRGKGGSTYNKAVTCRRFYDGSACLACDELEKGNRKVDNGKKDQDGFVKSGFSLNCIEFGLFQLVEATKPDGSVIRYESDSEPGAKNPHRRGDPIMQWERVVRPKDRKEILENLDEELDLGNVRLFMKKYMDVGPAHLGVLTEIDAMAGEFCKNCGTGNLEINGFECAECQEMLVDVLEANMTSEELQNYGKTDQRCTACGHTDLPQPIYSCDNCKHPDPYRWFEVIAKCRKTGENAQTTITVDKVIPIDQFELPDGTSLVKLLKNGEPEMVPMDSANPDTSPLTFVYEEDFAKLVENQFNFEDVHRPESNDEIAKWLDIPNPYASTSRGGSGSSNGRAVDDEPRRGGRGTAARGRGRSTPSDDGDDGEQPRRKEPIRRQR